MEIIKKIKERIKKITLTKKSAEVFVIDASITGIADLRKILEEICNTNAKIILTSITIQELERLQKLTNVKGADARHILALAAEDCETFENVLIDENYDTPNDCIIQYCAKSKQNITLLTSDKTMALKARMYNIGVQYFKQTPPATIDSMNQENKKICTLLVAKRINNQLIIPEFQTNIQSICVCSDGLEYTDGKKELKIGDDVYIATKKANYISFAHYKIISLYAENNCVLIFSKRIYNNNLKNINLPKASYKAFIKDFKARHDA